MCGTADGLIKVSGRRHNSDDLKATILAVDPVKFVYRGRWVTIDKNIDISKLLTWLNFSVKKVSPQILIEDIFGAYFVFFSMKRMRSDDIVSAGRIEYIESEIC